jgi:outer membrane protein assembly factor BamE (lipoprotein component of BamABCDE complex)
MFESSAKGKGWLYALLCVLIVILLIPLTFCVSAAWLVQGHGASASKFRQIAHGMRTKDVRQLLGSPSFEFSHQDGTMTWTYTRATWCQMIVHFSADGIVDEFDHDH